MREGGGSLGGSDGGRDDRIFSVRRRVLRPGQAGTAKSHSAMDKESPRTECRRSSQQK